ncbi:cytochrome P450 [Natronosporangium hydrolyticum]|uniref:Cytochrome P450 n=1 Tax=Natronosporangium hydrolyticum TaxID=2811111 RepID=A0A895YRI5_9ACTN|nr:cytochrome P450 [Natronosporangium hydrolyticum]
MSSPVRSYPFNPPDRLRLDPLYAELRRSEPLARVRLPFGEQAWLATRHQDVKVVLGDARFSRAAVLGRDEPRVTPQPSAPGLLAMDPPEHSRLRGLVARAFTARRVAELRPRTREIADTLLDRMVETGPPADLVAAFADPLPTTVISELLGVPEPDRAQFGRWTEAIVSTTSLTPEQIQEYIGNMHAYIAELVAQKRQQPTDDLLSAMIQARDERSDRLTEQEMVELAAGLLAAGQETTITQIPNFVYVLLTHPERWRQLCADPTLVPAAVEELLRFVPLGVTAAFPRYATEDVELGGVLVRAGEPVLAALHSANRDQEVYDRPDEIDFSREGPSHFGFGHGAHHCLGAQLARLELQAALEALVRRVPELRFAVPEGELSWKSGMLVRGLRSLPVAW